MTLFNSIQCTEPDPDFRSLPNTHLSKLILYLVFKSNLFDRLLDCSKGKKIRIQLVGFCRYFLSGEWFYIYIIFSLGIF